MHPQDNRFPHRRITLLPTPEPHLMTLALRVVTHCARLALRWNAPLIAISRDASGARALPRITPWATSSDSRPSEAGGNLAHPSDVQPLNAAVTAAEELFDLLIERWPLYGRPDKLSLLTDGSGLGFAPESPWRFQPGSGPSRLEMFARLTEIVPFHADGAWDLLTKGSPSKLAQ